MRKVFKSFTTKNYQLNTKEASKAGYEEETFYIFLIVG